MTRPLLLLSNDDGFRAQGLNYLRQALLPHADVVVCAPDNEQSTSSHSLSLHRPLRLIDHGGSIFSVDGTPADCVYVALHSGVRVLPRWPDAVISGINHGLNLGQDVFYSGTVAAAREGALKGVPALALSAALEADPLEAARIGAQLSMQVATLESGPVLFNANIPPGRDWEIRPTRLGRRVYRDVVDYRVDPRGKEYLWLGGPGAEHGNVLGSDTEAFDSGVLGVSSLVLDLWSREQNALVERVVSGVLAQKLG